MILSALFVKKKQETRPKREERLIYYNKKKKKKIKKIERNETVEIQNNIYNIYKNLMEL